MARLRPLGSGAAAFTRFASEGRSSARAYQNIAGYGRRPWAASLACRAVARGSMARLRPLGSGAAAFTRFASEGRSSARAYQNIAGYGRRPWAASLACRAVARGSMARLRPLGSGAAAFTRFASEGRSSARAYQNIAGYGRRPWAASLACRAVARGSMARLRPLGSGAAAFTRFASEGRSSARAYQNIAGYGRRPWAAS